MDDVVERAQHAGPLTLQQIKTTALALLARREHSQKELLQKLKIRHFKREEIEIVLRQLSEEGLQSDVRFTESYLRMRINKGYGPQRIALELRERGIEEELTEQLMNQFTSAFWTEQIQSVQRKKFGRIARNLAEKIKQIRFLQYRGFTMDQIKQAIFR